MPKQKILAVAIVVVAIIMLGVFSFLFYEQKYGAKIPVSKNNTADNTSGSATDNDDISANTNNSTADNPNGTKNVANIRGSFCSGDKALFDSELPKTYEFFPGLATDEARQFNGSYFCQGLIKADRDAACALLPDEEKRKKCEGYMHDLLPIYMALSGDKQKAKDTCHSYYGDYPLCDNLDKISITNNVDLKEQCPDTSSQEHPNCLAFFTGDEGYCSQFTNEQKDGCVITSRFMKAVRYRDVNSCDSLVSDSDRGNDLAVACKLLYNKNAQVCNDEYKKFVEMYCRNEEGTK